MKEWEYQPAPSLNQSMAQSLTMFPREGDMTYSFLRVSWNLGLRIFLKIYFRLTIEGRNNLPLGQSFVLVANHASHLDAVCLSSVLPLKSINRTFSVAAKDFFFSSFYRSFLSAIFINALPFDRKHNYKESLELCADVLNVSDQVLIMFPEGTRSITGEIQMFKSGIGLLVAGTDWFVVPAYIEGAHQAWPKGNKMPQPRKVRVTIGKPMNFQAIEKNKQGYEHIARLCEEAIRKLKAESII